MNAAANIGDDALPRTSAQRQRWFDTGLKTGAIKACGTFSARNL